jgi:putative endonuclease
MFYTYILRSLKDKHLYVGYTTDVQKRISEHNSGLTKSTKSRLQFELLFFEEFQSRGEAMIRERFFKTGKGKEYIYSKLLELND